MTTQPLEPGSARTRLAAWRFAQLAIFFVLFLLVLPELPHGPVLKLIASFFLLNSMLVADATNPHARVFRWSGWGLWTITTLAGVIEETQAPDMLMTKIIGIGAHTTLILACAASILTVVFRAGRVTLDAIFASVVAYQLIGLFFAQVYTLLVVLNPDALHLPDNIPASTENFQLEMIYFSFVTLATLGYGDILPDTSLARSISIIEAIVGQFYVAVVVAVLVSSFVSQKLADQVSASRD